MSKRIDKDKPISTKKKISFFSAVLLVIGSCIGAGIFFKNGAILSNTHESIVLSIVAWVVAIFGILCIALTIDDLVKGSGKWNSLGFIGWVRGFCQTGWYKGFRNFMMFVYLPTNFFFMPFYSIQSLQDALHIFGTDINSWVVILLAFIVMLYFAITCGLSSKLASVQNNIVTYAKFIPLLFAIVVGFLIFGISGGHAQNPIWPQPPQEGGPKTLIQYSATLGVIACVPAIFFAFDGFYAASASSDEFQEPKKSPLAMALGIAIVAAIYILVSLGMLLGSNGGTISGFVEQWENQMWWKVICTIMLLFIVFAVFGVVNGFALYGFAFYRSLIKLNEAPLSKWMNRQFDLNKSNRSVVIYTLAIYIFAFILFTIIGCFYYQHYSNDYGDLAGRIYSFADLISNWTSLLVFVTLGFAILGALHKHKYDLIKIKTRIKSFRFFATIALSLIFISTTYEVVSTVFDLVTTIQYQSTHTDTSMGDYLIPSILQLVILLLFVIVIVFPSFKKHNRHWTIPLP